LGLLTRGVCWVLGAAFLRNSRVPESVKQSTMELHLTGSASSTWESETLTMATGSTFDQVKEQLDLLKAQGSDKRVVEVRAYDPNRILTLTLRDSAEE
jgi:hypothetical protein